MNTPTSRPRVLLVGLGAAGRAVGAQLVASGRCEVVGAVDLSPEWAGEPLSSVLPGGSPRARVASRLDEAPDADIAFVATTSFLAQIEPLCDELLERGMDVVSICEELGFAWGVPGGAGERLDARAKLAGRTILGTGCNPGILLDTLPLLLSGLVPQVSGVRIRRTAEMSGYGGILEKFGFGLTPEAFETARSAGTVIGHVGFRESVGALAAGLGLELDSILVQEPEPVLLAPSRRASSHLSVEAGTIAVLRHAAKGVVDGRTVIDVAIDFGLFLTGDPFPEGDTWRIEAGEQDLEFSSTRIDSYLSTVAVAAKVIPSVLDLPPGVRTMADVPVAGIAGARAPQKTARPASVEGAGR